MLGMTPMDTQAQIVNRMNDLPERTKEFLSKLDEDDIENLEDAMRFYATVRTMGQVMKWLAITILAIIAGIASLYENSLKIWGWLHR
ncbi:MULTISPECIES: hypothetical protein [Brucella]|uniref:hypothetical protein n=1 Tax=Brucella TaxID=234 RepID=UPI00084FA6E6|nr:MULTISPECIES: hypothetical protein [Brucella]OEI84425.1 hypothetical protein BA060_03820 [Brucella sp. B13-0095]